jgi:hypothetical protein
MSKKVLNESEIRKFMKYANIGSLSKGFISRLNEGGAYGRDDDIMEQPEEEEMPMGGEEPEMDMGGEEPEMDMGGEEPEMDMGAEEGGGDVEAEVVVPEEEVDALKVARDVLDKILGAAEGEEGEGLEEPMPGEEEVAEPGEEEPLEDEEEVMQELEAAGIELQEMDDDLVQEVTRRVAARLLNSVRKNQ